MSAVFIDEKSTAGKPLAIETDVDLLVVGAGAAGVAAAVEALRLGLSVMLVEEHPIDPILMGMDIPLHFGQRMDGSERNKTRATEQVFSALPGLEEAFEAGVDVQLGTVVFGLFVPTEGSFWLHGKMAGLTDGSRSWLVRFKSVIVATGRRDMGLAFPGWEAPGVMGMTAAHVLSSVYDALAADEIVVVGSGTEAVRVALELRDKGKTIRAVIEASSKPLAPKPLVDELATAKIPLLLNHLISGVDAGPDGVRSVQITALRDGQVWGAPQELRCDTVLLGVNAVPAIDLLGALGVATQYATEKGGHVPILDRFGRSSVAGIYAAGDCAGIWAAKSLDADLARKEGRIAARAAASDLNINVDLNEVFPVSNGGDAAKNIGEWIAATSLLSPEINVCQCEEVTRREILGISAPRYLNAATGNDNPHDLEDLAKAGPPNQDQIKRLTRAGMGLCQGRRCREQVAAIVAKSARIPVSSVPLPTYRTPVRPLPLTVLTDLEESPALKEHWDAWFGIVSQWLPYWQIGSEEAAAMISSGVTYSE